jgi:hypothetical protein
MYHPRKTAGHACDHDDFGFSAERFMNAVKLVRDNLTARPTRAASISPELTNRHMVVLPSDVRSWADL